MATAPDFLPEETPEPTVVEDLTPYDLYLEKQTYRNTISVVGSELLQEVAGTNKALAFQPLLLAIMVEIHRKAFLDCEHRVDYNRTDRYSTTKEPAKVSRSAHYQMAVVLNRYLPTFQESQPALAPRLVSALAQAHKIEERARQVAEQMNKERSRGNVKFVKNLPK